MAYLSPTTWTIVPAPTLQHFPSRPEEMYFWRTFKGGPGMINLQAQFIFKNDAIEISWW